MAITRTLSKNSDKKADVNEKKSARKIVLEMRNELINDMLYELRNKKNDTSPWRKGYVKMNFTNNISGKDYKGINRFHLMRSARKNGFSDHRWITYNQMKAANEANGEPLYILEKGSKATKIEFHQWITPEEAKERMERQKAKGVEDEMIVKREDGYWVHKYYNVFNAQQFVRFPELEQLSEDVKNAMLDSALENSEAPIHYDQMDKNYYMPAKDEIHLVRKEYWEDKQKLYATALHEMAHSTGHSSRLNRPIENEFGTKEYALEELKADFASTILFQTYGLEQTEEQKKNSLAYLKHWYKILKEDPNQLVYAIKDAEKAVEYIEEHMMNKELVQEHLENKANEKRASNTKDLPQNPIDRIGVKIEWGEFPTTENNKLLIGGAATAFGLEIGKAIGGKEYERDVLYSGKDAIDLMKRIEFDNDRIQTSLINAVDKVNLEFYLDDKQISTHSTTLGEWDTSPEKNILFSQLKETNDPDMLRLEGYLKETFANKDDYIHEDPKKISALRKAAGANLMLDSTKSNGTIFELSFKHPELPKQILETDDVFKPMKELSNFKPIKVEDVLEAPVNMPAFPEASIQSQKNAFKKLEDINTFIELGLGQRESLPEEIQKHLEGASYYYEKCCNKLDEYNEYKELKEKLVASKEEKEKDTSVKINRNVLPKKGKITEVKKDSLPAGATYPQYEEPVIMDKPQKKGLGAKIVAPKKERGTTTRKRSGITGGR
ncbi:zincin-like metallopeptidase domain-containing protein [Veillonella sp. VA142]|uniref:zincin-like metallopeptidase domain-containing protein n=1 Tax=Veillonella sp. VA142 TaxID=741834 RepID=UPI000F8E27F4|nr:zincin-like metallopeptidase domain-containing protein [Veillonella sp. VA142]